MAETKLQKKLREGIVLNADPNKSREETLEDTFKYYVAELLKVNVSQNKNRIAAGFIEALAGHCISEFRGAELGEFQQSEKWYSALFMKTIKEIFDMAANNHAGEDHMSVSRDQRFEIDKAGWAKKNGLFVKP